MSLKQAEFLSFEGREALYGGAVGGGKSVAILAAALQYVDDPGYAGLILRRTYKQLAKADSILAQSKEWLWDRRVERVEANGETNVDFPGRAEWNGDDHKWTFPSGATLEFGHMEHEDAKHNYQGGAWAFIGVDEATQFTEPMLTYPHSRMRRRAGLTFPIRWRGASNPGGVGHDYIKARFVRRLDGANPATPERQFFPATLDDNPNIDREEYVATLRASGIDPLTLAQLLKGDWDAILGGRFRREWFARTRYIRKEPYYHFGDNAYVAGQITGRFLTVDPAATVKTLAKDDPDFTAISAWGKTPCGKLAWLGCKLVRCEIPDIAGHVAIEYARHKAHLAIIEGIGVGKGAAQLCKAHPTHMTCIEISSVKDKLTNAANAMNMAEAGRVWLPANDPLFPLEEVESQLFRFTGSDKTDGHDDVVDTLSTAANRVAQAVPSTPVKIAGELRPGG